jgi:hypothetical protein
MLALDVTFPFILVSKRGCAACNVEQADKGSNLRGCDIVLERADVFEGGAAGNKDGR